MKRSVAKYSHFVLALACLILPTCEEGPPGTASTPTISLNPSTLDMVVGETRSLDISASGGSGTPSFTFTVSPSSVATVTNIGGTVQVRCDAPGNGTINVTVTLNGRTLNASVAIVCRETTNFDLSPRSLAFTHTVGSTGCPQQVGTFRVTNTAGFAADFSIAPLHSALTVDVSEVRLEPGAFRDVVVRFNCSTQTSFEGLINVALRVPGRVESKTVQVTGTINR